MPKIQASLKAKVMKYMDVVNGKCERKEFIDLFVWGEAIHPDDGGDIGLALDWINRMAAKGVNLPCGNKLPSKREG
jgi:hypothetical protein